MAAASAKATNASATSIKRVTGLHSTTEGDVGGSRCPIGGANVLAAAAGTTAGTTAGGAPTDPATA